MSYLVFISVTVVNSSNHDRFRINALGVTQLEPHAGVKFSIRACGNFAEFMIEDVEEIIGDKVICVDCREVDHKSVSQPGPDISVEDVARGIAKSFQEAEWVLCEENGKPIRKYVVEDNRVVHINTQLLREKMHESGMTISQLFKETNRKNRKIPKEKKTVRGKIVKKR